jgi:hypothetical protein
MSDEIKPAMTAEEWEAGLVKRPTCPQLIRNDDSPGVFVWYDQGVLIEPPDTYALAAMCLYKQPFGFTRQDVEEIRDAARNLEEEFNSPPGSIKELRSIADRIEALLPPEEK